MGVRPQELDGILTFDSEVTCRKCDNKDVGAFWCDPNDHLWRPRSDMCQHLRHDDIDHIHRNCRCCGYTWLEGCLDGGG